MKDMIRVFLVSYNEALKSLIHHVCWPISSSPTFVTVDDAKDDLTVPTVTVMSRGDSSPESLVDIPLSPATSTTRRVSEVV